MNFLILWCMPRYWQFYMVLPDSTVVLDYGNVFHGDMQKSLGNTFQLKYCIFWWLSCLCLSKTWKMLIWTFCFVGSGGLEKTWYELQYVRCPLNILTYQNVLDPRDCKLSMFAANQTPEIAGSHLLGKIFLIPSSKSVFYIIRHIDRHPISLVRH